MKPRQPHERVEGAKSGSRITSSVIQILEDERAAVRCAQLPFRQKGQFQFTGDPHEHYFYDLTQPDVYIRICD